MASSQQSSDFRSAVDAAAVDWYAERHGTPNGPRSNRWSFPFHPQKPASLTLKQEISRPPGQGHAEPSGPHINSDITAWQTALQSLPADFQNQPVPVHPLPAALSGQPTLRPVEWNPYRHQGSFVPRTAHDFASMMIYICGQINPNPCRNCLLKNGPFAQCVVSPPEVLANSTIRHACANCTYQNQYKKCTNDPITEEEMARSMMAKGNGQPRASPLMPRKPKVPGPPRPPKKSTVYHQQPQHHQHMVRKQTPQSSGADTFADKLRQARALSPRSRRRMKAEALQWQAAIATVEAERTRSAAEPNPNPTKHRGMYTNAASAPLPRLSGHSARFVPFPSTEEGLHDMENEDDTEISEYGAAEGDTWTGFDGSEVTIKSLR
ncbi:hypothetical protein SCARD494_11014 [Seiridium cardinale]